MTPEPELWIIYEAAARGIANGRLARRPKDTVSGKREPTEAERVWARLAIDAALPYLRPEPAG